MFLTSMLSDRVYCKHDFPLLSWSSGLAPFSSKVWMSLSFWCLWHSFVSIPQAAMRTVICSSFRSLTLAPPSARIRPRRNFPLETASIRLQEDMFDYRVSDSKWYQQGKCVHYNEKTFPWMYIKVGVYYNYHFYIRQPYSCTVTKYRIYFTCKNLDRQSILVYIDTPN